MSGLPKYDEDQILMIINPITDDEYRRAGLNILDQLPDSEDDYDLGQQYVGLLQSLGFGE